MSETIGLTLRQATAIAGYRSTASYRRHMDAGRLPGFMGDTKRIHAGALRAALDRLAGIETAATMADEETEAIERARNFGKTTTTDRRRGPAR